MVVRCKSRDNCSASLGLLGKPRDAEQLPSWRIFNPHLTTIKDSYIYSLEEINFCSRNYFKMDSNSDDESFFTVKIQPVLTTLMFCLSGYWSKQFYGYVK